MNFELHPRLEQDTLFIAELTLSRLLLKNDKRFPWLILVPKKIAILEIDELPLVDQNRLLLEITELSKLIKALYKPDKLNIASLGNIVAQLHIHLIARYKNDSTWPSPVWGFEEPIPYPIQESQKMITIIQQQLPSGLSYANSI